MEKAVLHQERSRFQIHSQDVCCAIISILLGSIASPFAYMLVLIYCALSYIRSSRESTIVVFFVLLFSLTRGVIPAYFYALGFTCFFILVHLLRLMDYNIYEWMPGICTIIMLPYSIQQFGLVKEVIFLPLITYTIVKQMGNDYNWLHHQFLLPESIYGIVLCSIYLFLMEAFPMYKEIFGWILLPFLGVVCEPITVFVLLLFSYFCLQAPWLQLPIPLLLCLSQKQKAAGRFMVFGLGVYTFTSIWNAAYFMYCFLLLYVKKDKLLFLAQPRARPSMHHFPDQGLLKRQMLNYANIFQSLASYYNSMSCEESELLSTMADALQYNADIISKADSRYKERERIIQALEGYQYKIDELQLEEPKEGFLRIVMNIANIKRGEIKTTLKPLMEALLHRKLEVDEICSRRFLHGFHVCLSDAIPFKIEALADSVKNSQTGNGDTFSIFRFRQSMVCMISDGMGNGEKAHESSRLITNIFQRMMISGITQDAAIKCINKLIQSDTFATLDVLCFNYALGIAYISKSAACPTYLIRDHKLYEISGNALPVGIVSVMQPDCFSIELQTGDEFIMMSDGIEEHEFHQWMRERKVQDLNEDIEIFKDILQHVQRKDDSTYIIANVTSS